MGKVTDPSILSALEGGRVEDPAILAALEGKTPPKRSIVQRAKDIINAGVKASSAESDTYNQPLSINEVIDNTAPVKGYPTGFFERHIIPESTGPRESYISMPPKNEPGDIRPEVIRAPDSTGKNIVNEFRRTADQYRKNGNLILADQHEAMAGIGKLIEESGGGNAGTWLKQAYGKLAENDRKIAEEMKHNPRSAYELANQKITDTALGLLNPKYPLMASPVAFGAFEALAAYGRGEDLPESVKAGLKSTITAKAFGLAHGLPQGEAAAKLGGLGAFEAAVSGGSPIDILESGATQAAFGSLASISPSGRKAYESAAPILGHAKALDIARKVDSLKGRTPDTSTVDQGPFPPMAPVAPREKTKEIVRELLGNIAKRKQDEAPKPEPIVEDNPYLKKEPPATVEPVQEVPPTVEPISTEEMQPRVTEEQIAPEIPLREPPVEPVVAETPPEKPATESPLTDVPLEAKEASGEGVVSGNVAQVESGQTQGRVEVESGKSQAGVGQESDMDAMVADARKWKGAAIRVDRLLGDDRRARTAHSRMTTKGDLDAYLMKKYGIDESAARDVSNELTRLNLPNDETANILDFKGEPWADKVLGGQTTDQKIGVWNKTYDHYKKAADALALKIYEIEKSKNKRAPKQIELSDYEGPAIGTRDINELKSWLDVLVKEKLPEAARQTEALESTKTTSIQPKPALPSAETVTPPSEAREAEPPVSESPKFEPQTDLQSTGEPQKAKVSNEAPQPEVIGETKESTLAKRTEADAIEHTLTEGFGDLASYKTMSMKEQAESAQALMDTDFDLAQRIAMGQEEPPAGLRAASVYEAVKIRARDTGDVETLRRLATESTIPTKLSELGQEIKAADSRQMEDPVVAMQEVVKAREAVTEKTTGRKPKAHEAEVQTLKGKLDEVQKKLDEHLAKSAGDAIETLVGKTKPKAERAPLRYGSKNKIVSKADYEATKKALNERLNTQFNAGIDPVNIADMGKIGLYHLEAGMREFGAWSKHMVSDLGDIVKPHLKDLWVSTKEAFSKATTDTIVGKISKASEEGADLAEMGRFVQELAEHFVASGIKEREPLITAVHDVLKDIIPDLTRRDTMDAISGYGKFTPLSKDEIKTQLRDLKGQMQQVGKLEDLQNRQPPLKTGVERRTPSDEERRLIKLVEEAKKKYGIQVVDKETQLKSALDAIKTRLKNQISDLETQIASRTKLVKEKTAVARDAEAMKLTAKRDALKAQYDEIFGKTKMTDEQKIRMATASIEKSIAEYERRIKEKDMSIRERGAPITSPALKALREKRDKLKGEYQHLKDLVNPKKTPEQIALQSLKTRLKNEAAKLEGKMKTLDFTKKPRREIPLDPEAKRLKAERDRVKEAYQAASDVGATITPEEAARIVELSKAVADAKRGIEQGEDPHLYGAAKVEFDNYVEGLKGGNASVKALIKNRLEEARTTAKENQGKAVLDLGLDTLGALADTSVSMVASLDNSFLGRQGLKTLMTHPSAWWPAAKGSFLDFYHTLGGQRTMDALMADIYSRENYRNGSYEKAHLITKTEEQYPTNIPERIPLIGRLFKASEVAFRGSGMRMRADLYDLITKRATENGIDMTDPVQIKSYGKMINALTARGQWGERGEPAVVRILLWAPKMLKGNIDVLTAHVGQNMSLAAKMEARTNLVKIIAETATIMAIANALKPGSAELDPRSSDFGKIKVGDTRFDITGGAASLVTLASRIVMGIAGQPAVKNASTGVIRKYGTKFGDATAFDTLISFLTNKTPPLTGGVIDLMKGTTRTGKEATIGRMAYSAVTPIVLQNIINLKDNASADRVLGAIVDVVGISANSYAPSEADWMFNTTKEMQQFRDKVGDDKFKAANDKFNQGYNEWFAKIADSSEFQGLPDEDKKALLTQKKAALKKSILRKYGFHSRNTEHRRSSEEKTAKRRLLRGDID